MLGKCIPQCVKGGSDAGVGLLGSDKAAVITYLPWVRSSSMIKWDKALGAGPGRAGAHVLLAISVVSLGCITFGDTMTDRRIVFLLSEVKPAGLSVSLV